MAVVDLKSVSLSEGNRVIFHAKVLDITIDGFATSAEFEIEDPASAGDTIGTITCVATRCEKTSTPY